MTQPKERTCSHFTISNRRGNTQGDLPRLLRRLATDIAALGKDTMILDVAINDEIDDNGPWWEATVYYARDSWNREPDDEQETERPTAAVP